MGTKVEKLCVTVYSSEGNMDLVGDVYAYLAHKEIFHGMRGIDNP